MRIRHEEFTKQFIRLPVEIKAWIEAEAARHCSTQNSEIVRAIREKMERERSAGSPKSEAAA